MDSSANFTIDSCSITTVVPESETPKLEIYTDKDQSSSSEKVKEYAMKIDKQAYNGSCIDKVEIDKPTKVNLLFGLHK